MSRKDEDCLYCLSRESCDMYREKMKYVPKFRKFIEDNTKNKKEDK